MIGAIKWVASSMLVLAGLFIALKVSIDLIYISYFLFAMGHIIWIILFVKQKEKSLVFANIFFLIIDIVGIVQWIN